jgi:hypothetical protein
MAWGEAELGLRGFQNGECGRRTTKVKQTTAAGGDGLVVAGTGAEKAAELVVASTEALRRGEALEAAHAPRSAFDAAMGDCRVSGPWPKPGGWVKLMA